MFLIEDSFDVCDFFDAWMGGFFDAQIVNRGRLAFF